MKYCLIPFGCQMNISDSERISTVLQSLGYEPTSQEEQADILGVVACSVRQKAIDKVYSRIRKWNSWKLRRPVTTLISGCVLPADREKLVECFDLMFTIDELPHLPDMLRNHGVVTPGSVRAAYYQRGMTDEVGEAPQPLEAEPSRTSVPGSGPGIQQPSTLLRQERTPEKARHDHKTRYWQIEPSYSSEFEAYIPIQNGCDKFCSFCAVPYTRGREVSRRSSEILTEVRRLVSAGYRSLTLLGQNVNSYGLDRRDAELTFPDLLRKIGEIGRESDQRFWVYFTSPHPRDMTDEVIDVIREHSCLAKQIHLPLQSGDDKLLLRMKRNHGVDQYRRIVHKIRATIPDATLFTDIIVGFSGETVAQFERTRSAMREFQYNMAFIAMYSPRPGAVSARWHDDVPHSEKRRRLHELSSELQAMSLAYNERLVGTEVIVLVEGKDRKPGYVTGRTEGKLIVRFQGEAEELIGRFVNVRVNHAAPLSMEGTLVGTEVKSADAIPQRK